MLFTLNLQKNCHMDAEIDVQTTPHKGALPESCVPILVPSSTKYVINMLGHLQRGRFKQDSSRINGNSEF